jgi:uncharacterized protein YkwD
MIPARLFGGVVGSVLALASSNVRAQDAVSSPPEAPGNRLCDRPDRALEGLAEELAKARLQGDSLPSPETAARKLRGEGAVFPSLRWLLLVPRADEKAPNKDKEIAFVRSRARTFIGEVHAPRTACGLARVETEDGRRVSAIVVAPEHASLAPVPVVSRLGAWITLRAHFFEPISAARVVVLGPRGVPRTVPSSLAHGELVARFSADAAGVFSAQIVGETEEGPLPLAEVVTRVGSGASPGDNDEAPAPGETILSHDGPATVFAMLQGARAAEGRPPLRRDAALDRVAQAHAETLARRGRIAHDAGLGDPAERAAEAGIEATEIGENVAQSSTPEGCHRALWYSASHRENLLSSRFGRVGIGLAKGSDGSRFVVQLFASQH